MGDGLHQAKVRVKGVLDDLLAVAGGGGGAYGDVREAAVDLLQEGLDQGHGVAAVGQIAVEGDVLLGVQHHGLDGGGTGVDADVGDVVGLKAAGDAHLVLLVAGDKGVVGGLVLEQRAAADVGAAGRVAGDAPRQVLEVKALAVGLQRRAQGHIVERVLRQEPLGVQRQCCFSLCS